MEHKTASMPIYISAGEIQKSAMLQEAVEVIKYYGTKKNWGGWKELFFKVLLCPGHGYDKAQAFLEKWQLTKEGE